MSVCHSPGTLSFCVHGVPEKFGYAICNRNSCQCSCHANNKFMCIDCGSNHVDGSGAPFVKKEETITIKKALWDEMLEYKSKVDELEEWCASCSVCYPPHPKEIEERIENLEKHKNYQINENRKEARLIEILEAIETLETQMSRVIAYINEDNDRIEQLEKKLII
jgi:hypothetical protein